VADSLVFTLDGEQQRLKRGPLQLHAIGPAMKGGTATDTWLDPITNTLRLKPKQLDDAWFTSNAGDYAKLGVSSWTFTTPANWEDRYDQMAVGPCCSGIDSSLTSEYALSNTAYPQNTGWYLAWFSYGTGTAFKQLECGWNSSASGSAGVSLRFWTNGDVEVWKDGNIVATGTISGAESPQTTTGEWVEVLLIPQRGRELLIVSSRGSGFTTAFPSLIETTDEQNIVGPADGDSKFWWTIVAGAAQVYAAPIRYPSTGSYYTQVGQFPLPPDNAEAMSPQGDDWTDTYGYLNTATTVPAVTFVDSGGTLYTPDGHTTEAALKIVIDAGPASGGFYYRSPDVMGAFAAFEPQTDSTDGSESRDLAEYWLSADLTVGESASGVEWQVTLKKPDALDVDSPSIKSMSNRPLDATIGGVEITEGIIDGPSWSDAYVDDARHIVFKARDQWKRLELARFRSDLVLSGLELSVMIQTLLQAAGCGDLDQGNIETTSFTPPVWPDEQNSEWPQLVKAGDTAADWIERLLRDYAATWFWGIVPGEGFVLRSPDTMDAAPSEMTLYRCIQDALTAGVAADLAPLRVYRTLDEDAIEPEANEVWVTGWDRRLKRPIQAYGRDLDSQNAATAPSARPENWLGMPKLYGLIDPALTDLDSCEAACTLLYDQLTPVRFCTQITSALLIKDDGYPLWRGHKITLDGIGERFITSARCHFEWESWDGTDDDPGPFRQAEYVCASVVGRSGGSTLEDIRQREAAKGADVTVIRRGGEQLQGQPPARIVVLS